MPVITSATPINITVIPNARAGKQQNPPNLLMIMDSHGNQRQGAIRSPDVKNPQLRTEQVFPFWVRTPHR